MPFLVHITYRIGTAEMTEREVPPPYHNEIKFKRKVKPIYTRPSSITSSRYQQPRERKSKLSIRRSAATKRNPI